MRTKNENNVYAFTCAVTGKSVKTNPKQFFATAARYGVTDAVLKTSYISREGRKQIKDAKLTAEQVVAQYGVAPEVAAKLKGLAKPAVTETITVEVPAEAIAAEPAAETVETPAAEAVAAEVTETVEASAEAVVA